MNKVGVNNTEIEYFGHRTDPVDYDEAVGSPKDYMADEICTGRS